MNIVESIEVDRLLTGRLKNFLVNDGDRIFCASGTGVFSVDRAVGVA